LFTLLSDALFFASILKKIFSNHHKTTTVIPSEGVRSYTRANDGQQNPILRLKSGEGDDAQKFRS